MMELGKPAFRKVGPDYVAEDSGVLLRAYQLYTHNEGVNAALRVEMLETKERIYLGRVQLMGANSKKGVIRTCQERVETDPAGQIDWVRIIEQFCERVLNAEERGEEIVDLSLAEPVPDEPWLIQPVMRQESALIFGMGGTGKSLIALAFASLMGSGGSLGNIHTKEGNALYLDYESDQRAMERRAIGLAHGWGITRPRIFYQEAKAPLVSIADQVARDITEKDIRLLIIDHAAYACGGDPNKADAASAFFRALRQTGAPASLTIAHRNKADETMPFGSVFWHNGPRSVWRTKVVSQPGESTVRVGLFQTKANDGTKQRPIGFTIKFESDTIRMSAEDIHVVDEFRSELSIADQVVAALRDTDGRIAKGELADSLVKPDGNPVSQASVQRALRRMVQGGTVQVSGDHVELVPQGTPPVRIYEGTETPFDKRFAGR